MLFWPDKSRFHLEMALFPNEGAMEQWHGVDIGFQDAKTMVCGGGQIAA
jgi:hypothetical protein